MNKFNNNIFLNLKSIRMLFLGFSSGLPILLVFSTLSVWLVKAGVHRGMVTMFSWAGLAYSFKFIWTPLVDHFKLPFKKFLDLRMAFVGLPRCIFFPFKTKFFFFKASFIVIIGFKIL